MMINKEEDLDPKLGRKYFVVQPVHLVSLRKFCGSCRLASGHSSEPNRAPGIWGTTVSEFMGFLNIGTRHQSF